MLEQRGLPRNFTQHQVLGSPANDGVKNRIAPVGNGIDLDHLTVGTRAIVLRKLAERTFRFTHLGQNAALDHDFRMRRNPDLAGPALHHLDRTAKQCAGDVHFVFIKRGNCLRRQDARRMHSDHQRDLQGRTGVFSHLEVMLGVPRQQQHANAIGAADLTAMNRHVLHAGFRIARDQQRSGDIGTAVVLVVLGDRQLPQQIDIAMDHLLHRRCVDLDPRQWPPHRGLKTRQQFAGRSADRLGHPVAICEQIGDHRDGMAIRRGKHNGTLPLQCLRHRRQVVGQGDARLRDGKPVGGGQMPQPAAQIRRSVCGFGGWYGLVVHGLLVLSR